MYPAHGGVSPSDVVFEGLTGYEPSFDETVSPARAAQMRSGRSSYDTQRLWHIHKQPRNDGLAVDATFWVS